jgi:regulatory protein
MRKDLPPASVPVDAHKTLLKKAAALLARRAYTRGELRAKISRLSDASQTDCVLDRLEQLNLLNDADYAYNFALRRITQDGWGPAKVMQSLLRRHVGQAVVETALDRVRAESGSGCESPIPGQIHKYCEKMGVPADAKQLRKLIAHLRRHGFEDDNILSALRQTIPAALLQRFETGE